MSSALGAFFIMLVFFVSLSSSFSSLDFSSELDLLVCDASLEDVSDPQCWLLDSEWLEHCCSRWLNITVLHVMMGHSFIPVFLILLLWSLNAISKIVSLIHSLVLGVNAIIGYFAVGR